ncbi:BglG family transcription antiterminator [Bacillus sp. FJAT-49736]|uniref:BglG family transcription antiterminator n=1 Tax=Bacillus sp. FJAT-49736 TaxID=2833582 RepID=UPI001BC8F30C|nr:BglG family transcription antiterminator [Bacillus sp. FJAT-49736]MBS4174267.1 BglG family transcription antiterminator [Bacillus sp. FJAT-49736]
MLDERAANLLRVILSNRLVTLKQLEQQTNCSRRQVQYDLQKINNWLGEQKLPLIVNKRAHGLMIEEEIRRFVPKVFEFEPNTYAPSHEERITMILVLTFLKKEYLSLNHLTQVLRISRNTALSYVKLANSAANQFGLQIEYSRRNGYYFSGNELDIRHLLLKRLANFIQNPNGIKLLKEIFQESEEVISFQSHYEKIYSSLICIEKELNVTFVEEKMMELATFFTFLFERVKRSSFSLFPGHIEDALENTDFLNVAMIFLERLEITLPPDEIMYISMQLMGLNIRYHHELFQKENDGELHKVLDEIVNEFEKLACVTFANREQAIQSLYMHIRPAYYRMVFNIPISNPYLSRIKKEYFDLFILVKKSLKRLEEYVKVPISEDEIGYIALHFGSFLKSQGLPIRRKRAIIVCPNGIGTSNMLKSQLEKLIPEIEITKIISLREYDFGKESEIDVVFSTVFIQTNVPLIVINPILSAIDKARIIQEVDIILHGSGSIHPNINSLLQVIKLFSTVHDEEGLSRAIADILVGTIAEKIGRYKPVLNELLTSEMLQLEERVDSWEEAISLAAKPLLETQAIDQEYINAMIQNVIDLGPYIVMAPNVAIPHARPEQGVKKLGMSLLRLKSPVCFSSTNPDKKANIIIVLAAVDSETHLKALSQLTELLEEESNIAHLIAANTVEDMLPVIMKYSHKEKE